MTEKSAVERGWDFSSRVMGANVATEMGEKYVKGIDDVITRMEEELIKRAKSHGAMGIDQLQGCIFEEWIAWTYNVNAKAAGLSEKDFINVERLNGKNSVDLTDSLGNKYSAKSCVNYKKTAYAQAKIDKNTGKGRYDGQIPVVPEDQLEQAREYSAVRAKENRKSNPELSESYKKVSKKMTSTIENDEGVKSLPSTREHNVQMAEEAQKGEFKGEEHGVTAANNIKKEYIVNQALKAGYTAAIITAVTQIAPEIYKALDYLIKNHELRLEDILHIGEKGISGTAEGFLRGSVSSSLCIACKSGMLGEASKAVSPEILGIMVTLTMQTIKNSVLVAAGKMTPQQMGEAFIDTAIISSGYLIGGTIGQALLAGAPVVGYLLGSLVGTAFSVVYNIGKKKFISFCVDTGFTCFGLVEQDYQLPEEFLNKMGINTIKLNRSTIHQTNVSHARITQTAINRQNYETIGFTMPRRGLIGVNKVGYVI